MKRRRRNALSGRFIFTSLLFICGILLFAGYSANFNGGIFTRAASAIFLPMQRGIDAIGSHISVNTEEAKSRSALIQENQELRSQLADAQDQVSQLQRQTTQLKDLQELYQLDQSYGQYPKTAAHVIARDSSNWFNSFTIDKGAADGMKVNMNVMAGKGLIGIITEVGTHYAIVDTIINDASSVSAQISDKGQNLITTGSLKDMTESNVIRISSLEDPSASVAAGDAVVTSNISDKYLPGILIGYVTNLTNDANKLTRSGSLTPAADFKKLREVLVITQIKETGDHE